MLRIDVSAQSVFNSFNYRVNTPDGTMFINILEDKAGVICGVEITVGKSGGALKVWSHSFARMITMGLEHGVTLEELCTELSSQNSDKARITGKGINIRSGVDGVYYALMQYRADKFTMLKEALGLHIDDDIDQLGRRASTRRR